MSAFERSVAIVTDIVALARTQQVTLLAAGVAFYAFLSLVPLALLVIGAAASIGGEALADRLTAAASGVLTPSAQELLTETVLDDTGRQSATALGAAGLLWGSSRVLRGLDRAFSQVYGTAGEKSFFGTLRDATLALLGIVIGLTIVGTLEVAVRLVPGIEFGLLGPVFVVIGLLVTFLPLYVVFPDADVGLLEAIPGALIAAIGWFLLSRTFTLYAAIATEFVLYGALGAVFLVLIWLYVGSIILLVGAICNAVLADAEPDRQLQSPGGQQFTNEAMTEDATGVDEGAEAAAGPTRRTDARTRDRATDTAALSEEIERLRDRIDAFEDDVESRTVKRSSLEAELKRYVRRRSRRGHARGWGPYLVLLYGTAASIAAFYFLEGGWAILAMLVVWTSTLGVYVLMVLFGLGLTLLGVPGRLRDTVGRFRSSD